MKYARVAVLIALSCIAASPAATAAAAPSGSVVVRVKIPPRSTSSARGSRLRPLYVSPSTKSIAVLTDGQDPQVANVSGDLIEVRLRSPVGTHVFTISAYDQLGAHGNVLSTGSTAPLYVPASGSVQVAIVLGGVVSTIKLALYQREVTIGSTASVRIAVSAFDADGNLIITPSSEGPYGYEPLAQPITLASSDPVDGKLSITTYSATDQEVRVAYDGANVRPISIGASAPGATPAAPATLTPKPPPPDADEQLIFPGSTSTAIFPGSDQILTTFGAPPLAPFHAYNDVAVDAVNRLAYFVTEYYTSNDVLRTRFDVYETTGARRFVESFPNGNPGGVAIDSAAHKLYFSDFFGLDITVMDTELPYGEIPFSTGLCGAGGPSLAVDPHTQRLFVSAGGYGTSQGSNCGGLNVFSTVAPYAHLATLLPGPTDRVAVDVAAGRLYVTGLDHDYQDPYIAVFDTSSLKLLGKVYDPRTGPFQTVLAVDDRHLLYTSDGTTVFVYRTDAGFPFPFYGAYLNEGFPMAIAPYANPTRSHVRQRI